MAHFIFSTLNEYWHNCHERIGYDIIFAKKLILDRFYHFLSKRSLDLGQCPNIISLLAIQHGKGGCVHRLWTIESNPSLWEQKISYPIPEIHVQQENHLMRLMKIDIIPYCLRIPLTSSYFIQSHVAWHEKHWKNTMKERNLQINTLFF